MTYKEIEDKLNQWKKEIKSKRNEFTQQANDVNDWDSKLVANNEKIVELHREVEKVNLSQLKLERDLKIIRSQQGEIAEILLPLEEKIAREERPREDDGREETYVRTENINTRLDQACTNLKQIITRLNATSGSEQQLDDPMVQVGQILGAHVDTLSWVEKRTETLLHRIESLEHRSVYC